MTREELLEQIKKCILNDRQNTYGKPEDNFQRIADFWNIYLHNGDAVITKNDVAVMMSLLKIARIMSSPNHIDNYIDGAGYLTIAGSFIDDNAGK